MSVETNLSNYSQEIHESLRDTPLYQAVLNKSIPLLKNLPSLSEDTKEQLLGPLKELRNSLEKARKAAAELFSSVNGQTTNSVVNIDNRASNSHLTIIESGELLEKYQTADDLENVDVVIKRLHRISYLVHCCGSEVLYDCIFQPVGGEESQSNKKQKKTKKFQLKMVVKFPVDTNTIDPNGKLPMDSRVIVNVIHSGNIGNWNRFRLHGRLHPAVYNEDGDFVSFQPLQAVSYHTLSREVNELMRYLKDNQGQVPEDASINVIAEPEEHGGIPIIDETDETDKVLMDFLCILNNIDSDNLRTQGDGPGERRRDYHYNKIINHSIPEGNLIAMWDWVDIGHTLTLQKRQYFYGTMKSAITSLPIWEEVDELFTFAMPYLCTPNLLQLLTLLDTDPYVSNNRNNQDYYRKNWDDDINLPAATIDKIRRDGLQCFVPLFKLVHFEKDRTGKLHIFFQKCPASSGERGDWMWANYLVTGHVDMCVSSLGWVSSSGIAPVRIKRDPPTHEGVDDNDNVEGGGAKASLSGHKYTGEGDMHRNCPYRVVETTPGSGNWVYPGRGKLVSSKRELLEKWGTLTQNVQGQGAKLIAQGLDSGEEVPMLEALLDEINFRLG